MRILVISTFLVNLLTMTFVGLVFQDQVKEREVVQRQAELVAIALQQEERQKEVDFRKFPNLRIGGFTKTQTKLLATAYELGQPYGNETREIVQGVLLQESNAGLARIGGLHLPVGLRYYGVMQMKVTAVQDVLMTHRKYQQLFFGKSLGNISSEEIIAKLMTDDRFSIIIAYDYYSKYRRSARDVYEAIVTYNQGPGGVKRVADPSLFEYAVNVMKHVQYNVRPFNRKLEKELNKV